MFYLFIASNIKKENISQFEKFLEDNDMSSIVDFEKEGILQGLCSIRLPTNDIRLNLFLEKIKETNNNPFVRFDREYSKEELDQYEYLVLLIKTVGLENPKENQKYDKSNSCPNCGAGIIPIPPLIIPINSMGKKLLEYTAHNNWLIFKREFSDKIIRNELTGISFHPTKIGKNSSDYLWGKIDNILPRLNSSSKIRFNETKCETCYNSGNFSNFDSETNFVFSKDQIPLFKDFNLTNEFFGEWEYSRLGGSRLVIIHQKVRNLFINERFNKIDYLPIIFI